MRDENKLHLLEGRDGRVGASDDEEEEQACDYAEEDHEYDDSILPVRPAKRSRREVNYAADEMLQSAGGYSSDDMSSVYAGSDHSSDSEF